MKILLLGDFSGNPDEGMKNISSNLVNKLSIRNEVMTLSPRDCSKFENLKDIKKFSPEIIHYIHGPSIKSFFLVKLLRLLCLKSRTVMSITNPRINNFWMKIVPALKPSLALTQSSKTDIALKKLRFKTIFFPNGVDIEKFKPVDKKTNMDLRARYNISPEKFVILHVGHIKKNRNLEIFSEIQKKITNVQVIIVGSTHFEPEINVERKLKESGCLIWRDYYEAIEEIYNLSNCYVFPVISSSNKHYLNNLTGCIEIPMSVLEAMACNLPVITTMYGGLPDLFKEDSGLYYYDTEQEFYDIVEKIIGGKKYINNREKVLYHSWDNMVFRLKEIYKGLV